MCVRAYVRVKVKKEEEGIFKVYINLKTNENQWLLTKIIVLIKYLMRSS